MERKTAAGQAAPTTIGVAGSRRSATAIGLCAVLLWGGLFALTRLTTLAFGSQLGAALIYTLAAALTFAVRRPPRLRDIPRTYLLSGGALFVFYESATALAIGLAASSTQTVEISLVNYLWPTFLFLFASARSGGGSAVARALPGALVAAAGVIVGIGGNNGLDWGAVGASIASNPLPFALILAAALTWPVYSVITPELSGGHDCTAIFLAGVAVALWALYLAGGAAPMTHELRLADMGTLLATACVIAAGYGCWGHGALHGNMQVMAIGSYATPLLSVIVSTLMLGVSLQPVFWAGTVAVVAGSLINWRASR